MQMRDTLAAPPLSASKSKGAHRGSRPGRRGDGGSDSDETLSNGSNPNDIVPKEEGMQHCWYIPGHCRLSAMFVFVCLVFSLPVPVLLLARE